MEVDTLATTLSAVFLSPEIGPVIKHALLLAWAYGESLTDVKTLLAGKKVPAVKSKESWNLTLDGLLELAKNRSIPEGKETVLPLILKPASFADTAHKNFPLLSPSLPGRCLRIRSRL